MSGSERTRLHLCTILLPFSRNSLSEAGRALYIHFSIVKGQSWVPISRLFKG
jgi:hypothetical protein